MIVYFIGCGDAGELDELARQCPAIQTFWVSRNTDLQWGVDEDFDEAQSILLVSTPGPAAIGRIRTDDGHDARHPGVSEQAGHFADATAVLRPVVW